VIWSNFDIFAQFESKGTNVLTLHAYAKINLGLRITGILPNGYHAIHSLFLPIRGLFDVLTFELHEDSILFTDNCSFQIPAAENLVMKAAYALKQFSGTTLGAKIHLHKRIPAGAGMGGGSSDAAVTLRALTQLWNIDISPENMLNIALSLGSDIPYFLQDQPAIVEGQGEIIRPIAIELNAWILIILPGLHIGTAWAYAQVKDYASHSCIRFEDLIHDGIIDLKSHTIVNDFEPPIHAVYPELAKIKKLLLDAGADLSLMSGSGSTMYGIFSSKADAVLAQRMCSSYESLLLPLQESMHSSSHGSIA